ncbi:hypothetical protein ACHAO3_002390 [Verticillium nonalfalfae]
MAGNGIWHKTSVQAAQETKHTYSKATLPGQKRSYSDVEPSPGFPCPIIPSRSATAQRSVGKPVGSPRLSASPITTLAAAHRNRGLSEYSQRRTIQATPSSSVDPFLSLAHTVYGLPRPLIHNFAKLGIHSIYPWQKACLLGPGLLSGEKNLIYSAPTGGGKSLVADVLMLKRVLEDKDAKAILVLPYVALVQEKVRWLRHIVDGLAKVNDPPPVDEANRLWRRRADENTIRVVGFFGGGKVQSTWADFDIGVCTIEKANAMINTAIDDCSIKHLRIVVLDELHMIDDDHRGYLMELMATKLISLPQSMQVVGMSATLSNIRLLSTWLDGHSYETKYRPVPVEEHLVYESHVYPAATTSEALLEVIAIRLATSRDSIDDYAAKTLLACTGDLALVRKCVQSSLDNLLSLNFVEVDGLDGFRPTQLGKAIVASALDPDDGTFIHKELQRALKAFVMDGEMHILYMFTPVQDYGTNINWQVFRNEMEALDDSGHRVLGFLGLKRAVINRLAQGGVLKGSTAEEQDVIRVHRRFYMALQLRDLCNEMPIHVVARKYDVHRGAVQTLSQTCTGFAAGMIKFCEQMGWGIMSAALDHFSDRLRAGARADLLALAKITFIKSRTARIFWESGYRSIAAVANADPRELVPILLQAQPSKVRVKAQDSSQYEEKMMAKAQVISNSANRLWQIEMQHDVYEE